MSTNFTSLRITISFKISSHEIMALCYIKIPILILTCNRPVISISWTANWSLTSRIFFKTGCRNGLDVSIHVKRGLVVLRYGRWGRAERWCIVLLLPEKTYSMPHSLMLATRQQQQLKQASNDVRDVIFIINFELIVSKTYLS